MAVVFYRIVRLCARRRLSRGLPRSGAPAFTAISPATPTTAAPEADIIWYISAALANYESVRLGARLRGRQRKLGPPWGTGRRPRPWVGGMCA